MAIVEFQSRVIKAEAVEQSIGLILGWGIICTKSGEPYFDLQNQYCPPDLMLKSVTDFMAHSRLSDEMHDEVVQGPVVHSFPLIESTKRAFGITCDMEGWMIGAMPGDEVVAKFVSGEYTGFSIGGRYRAKAAA